MEELFNHHELKTIFTAVRRYQKNMVGNKYYEEEYQELSDILTKLQPLAYSQTYS